jgi:hypothetical protein
MLLLLGDAFGSCRLPMSGFHAIHIAAVQAMRAIYLEKWASICQIYQQWSAQYYHRPAERPEPVNVASGTDRNNADGVSRNAGQNHPING